MSGKKNEAVKLDKLEAARILENIFEECEEEPNTIPMEELSSYSNYKKETFLFQKIVLGVALAIFVLLPFFFIAPKYTVTYEESGERGLPVYRVEISTILPIRSVTAVLDDYRLPVYEVDSHTYTIEPTRNGNVDICVTLFNHQYNEQEIRVKALDQTAPSIEHTEELENGGIRIYLSDVGAGIDYEEVYATKSDGSVLLPDTYDSVEGYVEFDSSLSGAQVFIMDYFGNTLTLNCD